MQTGWTSFFLFVSQNDLLEHLHESHKLLFLFFPKTESLAKTIETGVQWVQSAVIVTVYAAVGGENRNPQPFAFAVKHKEDAIRERSSSGGVFYALAEYTLNMGGTVYGAVFGEQNQVLHMRGSDLKDVHKMQGSKYVQSSTEGIFEAVKKDLEEGKRERNPKRTDKNTYSKNIKRYFFNYFREEI